MARDHTDEPTYARVSPRFWAHAQESEWSDDMVILGLYLLTCEQRTTEGLYRLPIGYIASDLPGAWVPERVRQSLSRLVAEGFVEYDEKARIVFIPKAMKYQRPDNPNQQRGAIRKLKSLPVTSLLTRLVEAADAYCEPFAKALREAFPEALSEGFGDPQALNSSSSSSSRRAIERDQEQVSLSSDAENATDVSSPADAVDNVQECTDVDVLPPDGPAPAQPQDDGDDGFEAFWALYIRKEGKVSAERAWRRMSRTKRNLAFGIAGVMSQLHAKGMSPPRQFIKTPAAWLRGEHWNDWRDGPPATWIPDAERRNGSHDLAQTVRQMIAEGYE